MTQGDGEDWPDPLAEVYELRLTGRALEDLGAGQAAPGDLTRVQRLTAYPDIVAKFAKMRSRDPRGSESPLSKVHRNDIFKLDGRDGQRAVTWHDTRNGVVWLLGFTAEHDYDLFVGRAARAEQRGQGGTSQLLPSVDDYEALFDERAEDEVDRVAKALEALVSQAAETPGVTVRGALAGVVRAEAHIVTDGSARTLHLRFRTPPVRKGVLAGGFEWILIAMLPGVDPASIRRENFPGSDVRGALIVAARLDD